MEARSNNFTQIGNRIHHTFCSAQMRVGLTWAAQAGIVKTIQTAREAGIARHTIQALQRRLLLDSALTVTEAGHQILQQAEAEPPTLQPVQTFNASPVPIKNFPYCSKAMLTMLDLIARGLPPTTGLTTKSQLKNADTPHAALVRRGLITRQNKVTEEGRVLWTRVRGD